jgi:hypothetical protein
MLGYTRRCLLDDYQGKQCFWNHVQSGLCGAWDTSGRMVCMKMRFWSLCFDVWISKSGSESKSLFMFRCACDSTGMWVSGC